jgi:hypothetical protein
MLLTRERVEALNRINRFAGWTTRPYSVLEHSVIGAKLTTNRTLQKAFLLHDMEESAFGDIITPVKRKYMPPAYFAEVEAWVRDLAVETSVPFSAIDGDQVHMLDATMLAAEKRTIYAGHDRHPEASGWTVPIPTGCHMLVYRAEMYINDREFAGENAITAFWQMWGGE